MNDQAPSDQTLLHAIDLALLRDWGQAKALAESVDSPMGERLFLLFSAIEEREAWRLRRMANVRHEVGNALSIAQANLEAIVDGLLQPTEDRLNALLAALATASTVLENLRRADAVPDERESGSLEGIDLCEVVESQVSSLRRLAASKQVAVRHLCGRTHSEPLARSANAAHLGNMVQDALLAAIRYTPPGGAVEVACVPGGSSLTLQIRDTVKVEHLPLLAQVLKNLGGNVRIDGNGNGENVLFVNLPLRAAKAQP